MELEGNKNGWKVQNCYILERMQNADAIPSLTRMEQDDGSVCYFFGGTCIQTREIMENGKIRLEPLTGEQKSGKEWAELAMDRVYGYCTLLERYLNTDGLKALAERQETKLTNEGERDVNDIGMELAEKLIGRHLSLTWEERLITEDSLWLVCVTKARGPPLIIYPHTKPNEME